MKYVYIIKRGETHSVEEYYAERLYMANYKMEGLKKEYPDRSYYIERIQIGSYPIKRFILG